ncbi:hypothetical protein SELMODRAFT_408218 [Selaginella moellendorffii]|uniref:Major facilitator superfamily (MFS) profile domain-containing protein n=1 Tax=Selaginella moellendorffii TaxID=88036 RepID=D8R7K6_SELML|nr:protein ZINC INDUCED FACILITATOR-LIKE 1 isoform X1 [Selaginella moellendorffii]EFJ31897.1 hypothetical protein SELMODRAFT_408218 [Selaginella moellendorffii]|eukprot:XP_002967298.1 protein ZINC INDUCED FACILITATOR-LIKE 1 isoform X1 [Selaginella moellendorffii]
MAVGRDALHSNDQDALDQPLLLDPAKLEAEIRSCNHDPDCPGCRVAYLKHPKASAPLGLLLGLAFVLLCTSLPISVVYPFVYFMVKDFHIARVDTDIGFYAGWIGSSFMIGRASTGMLWGSIADRFGRKPTMFAGVASVVVLNTLFGLSTNFWMAVTTRFILGCFNGMLGVVQAYASELCNEEQQPLGLSVVGTAWGLGLIVGPAVGGYLAQPALKFPSVFASGSLFDRFPYLLQALCISSIAVFGLFVVCLLPETLHRKSSVPKVEDLEKSNPLDSKEDKVESIFRNWPLMAATTLYCLWSLHDMAYSELFSLWSVSPKSYGGLGFTSSQVGSVLAVAGCAMLGAQLGVFPTVCRMVGPIRACRFGALITIPLLVAYPYFGRIQGPWLSVTVYAAAILKYILTTAVLTGSFILINNCVKQRQRGAANGFSLSIVSVFKGLGPAIGGIVFSCAQKRQHSWFFPGDHLVFLFLNVFALLTVLTSFEPFLPKSANRLIADD